MTWPNIDFKILTKQHQNINRITKEMKYCFQKMTKKSAWMAMERTKENSAVWKPFVKQARFPCWTIYRFWWSLSFVIKKKLSFIFVKHGKHEGQILQFTEQFCGNEKKSPPPKNHVPNVSHCREGKEKGRCVWTKWPWIGWWCPFFVIAFRG